MPGTTNTINVVSGTKFTNVTFNGGTNTFQIPGNYTNYFAPNYVLTALGGAPNGGYQIVLSSTFTGGNTIVTVASYSTGTAYPGPATFTAATGGTVIWFNNTGTPPITFPTPTDLLAVYALTSPGVIVGGGSTGFTTTDGIGYEYNAITRTLTNFWGVTDGYSYNVTVGDSGAVFTSPDGIIWTANNQGSNTLYGVAYMPMGTGNTMVAVGANGTIYATATPTSSWTANTSGTSVNLYGICSQPIAGSQSYLYACGDTDPLQGDTGIILQAGPLTSGSGTNYTWTELNNGIILTDVSAANNSIASNGSVVSPIIVAVGNNGQVLTTTDPTGATWNSVIYPTPYNLHCVVWDSTNSLFVAVGDMGTIITSPDGVSWTTQTSGTSNNLYGVSHSGFGGIACIAVGQNNTILTTPDDVTWTTWGVSTLWTRVDNNIFSADYPYQLAVSNSTQAVVITQGFAGAYTSDGGNTWTYLNPSTIYTSGTLELSFNLSCNNSGDFVFIGQDSVSHTQVVLHSNGGATWTNETGSIPAVTGNGAFYSQTASLFFLFDGNFPTQNVWTSPDGVTWTSHAQSLSSVVITDTTGDFSCTASATMLAIGQTITISGILSGTGSITGYSNPTTYYIIATNGTTTFQLSTTSGGSPITTTAGTTTGWTFTTVNPSPYYFAEGSGVLVMQGFNGTDSLNHMFSSTDAITWTQRTNTGSNVVEDIFNNEQIVWTGSEFFTLLLKALPSPNFELSLWTSPDGITWTEQSTSLYTTPASPSSPPFLFNLGYFSGTGDVYNASGGAGNHTLGVTTTGASWSTVVVNPVTGDFGGGNGGGLTTKFDNALIFFWGGGMASSADGTTWLTELSTATMVQSIAALNSSNTLTLATGQDFFGNGGIWKRNY